MTREEMLKAIEENRLAIEKCRAEHPNPQTVVIYFENDKKEKLGHIEYNPEDDKLKIVSCETSINFGGEAIEPLCRALSKLL